MKKLLCALFIALLFAPSALAEEAVYAEGTDVLLKNPRDAYEFYMERTDGSDQLMFMLLDSANDEETLTADGSAVFYSAYEVLPDGTLGLTMRTFAFTTDYGKTLRVDTGSDDPAAYCIGAFTYVVQAGNAFVMSESGADQLETAWSTLCFPAVFEMTLNSIRAAEDGTSYYLITGGDGCQYEYKTDDGLHVQELRIYVPDGDDFLLDVVCVFDVCEAPALPDLLIDALAKE